MGSTPVIQTSFNAGEWAPALNARVDVQKYHSGAALLRNFFVDYRGGATTRPGSRFILPTRFTTATRLIPFQASFTVSYVLEFGNGYIRFFNNGAPVLEAAGAITGITNANPGVITDPAHGFSNGDWVFLSGIGGTTQLNGNYYIVAGATTNTFTLTDLFGNPVDTTSFGVYTSGGVDQRVYTLLTSPYTSTDLPLIKFAQNVNILILCHPNYPPYQLVLNSATNWVLTPITFGTTVTAPASVSLTTSLGAGSVTYAYAVTAVDANGQESGPRINTIASLLDIRSTLGTITISWAAVAGAVSYNVYKAEPTYSGYSNTIGIPYGFIGNSSALTMVDSNIAQDFSQGPPVVQTPFGGGSGVTSLVLTAGGSGYRSSPNVTLTGGGPAVPATAFCNIGALSISLVSGGHAPLGNGSLLPTTLSLGYGISANVSYTTVFYPPTGQFVYTVSGASLSSPGALHGSAPANPVAAPNTGGLWFDTPTFNVTWRVTQIALTTPGSGYVSAPTVVFSGGGGAAATAAIGTQSASGNPTVPGFFQQRLVLAGPVNSPQQFNMSQPGSYYNFNINNPIEADDAIQGTLVSGTLSTIQSMVPQPQGLIMLADKMAWLINGGSPGSAISAIQIVANVQAFNGASLPPPIVANDNVLYVQAKGSIVRDLVFNFYTQIYTGADISVLSSHLFYGYSIKEWAWAEEPFKIVWAVRSDGTMLTLTFLKEQELVAWSHSDTQGTYQSVASVTEATSGGSVDAVYAIVSRFINGQTVQYVERFVEQSNNLSEAWCVDAGIQFTGFAGPSTSPPLPRITSLSPNSGPLGSVITINGNFFTGATLVTFGGVTAAFTFVNANTITATVPVGSGTVDVQVTTTYGPSALVPADQFTYAGPAEAFIARALVAFPSLDATHQTAYLNLIDGLIVDGVWSKFDMLHIYATQDSSVAPLNLVSTSYNGVVNGSPTFTVDRGFTGGVSGGGTVFINTTFNPSSATSPNYILNSGHLSCWGLNDIQETRNCVGATGAGIFPKFTDNNAYFAINAATNINTPVANAVGHYIANRSASNAIQGYKNGSSIISGSVASTGVPNFQYYVLSDNNGAPLGASNQLAMASIGSSLSATDVTNFYNRLRTYMTAVGVP